MTDHHVAQFQMPQNAREREVFDRIFETVKINETIIAKRKAGLLRQNIQRRVWLESALTLFSHYAFHAWLKLQALSVDVPDNFLQPYSIPVENFERYGTPPKYRSRPYNLLRELLRIVSYIPEALTDKGLSILDLSSGACANYEILRRLGHSVICADYLDPAAKQIPYKPLWNHYGLQPVHFDGRQLPYPFEDQSFDFVLCHQAINFYCKQNRYAEFISHICKPAKTAAVLVFNARQHDPKVLPSISKPDLSSLGGNWATNWQRCPETQLPGLVLQRR